MNDAMNGALIAAGIFCTIIVVVWWLVTLDSIGEIEHEAVVPDRALHFRLVDDQATKDYNRLLLIDGATAKRKYAMYQSAVDDYRRWENAALSAMETYNNITWVNVFSRYSTLKRAIDYIWHTCDAFDGCRIQARSLTKCTQRTVKY